MLLDKLHYLSRVATYVVFSGSLPRDVEDDFYAEAIRDLNRRGVQCVLDCEGEPLRLGVEAEPFLVSPNQREAESLVGQEFSDDEDFLMALDTIADLGARNVLITQETSCFALFREERQVAALPRVDRRASSRSRRSAPATCCSPASSPRASTAARSTTRCARRSAAPRRRSLELGAGRFDPREAARLAAGVELEELEPVEALGRGRSTKRARIRPRPLTFSAQASAAALERQADRVRRGLRERAQAPCESPRRARIERPTRKTIELVARRRARSLVAIRDRNRAERRPVRRVVPGEPQAEGRALERGEHVRRERDRDRASRAATTLRRRALPVVDVANLDRDVGATRAARPRVPTVAAGTYGDAAAGCRERDRRPACPGASVVSVAPMTRWMPPPASFFRARPAGERQATWSTYVDASSTEYASVSRVAGDAAEPEPGPVASRARAAAKRRSLGSATPAPRT